MIQFDRVSFKYSGSRKWVLSDIRLELAPGHIYGLLGKNGVGKSTLFRLICGMNPPSEGTVRTHGFVPFERTPAMLEKVYLLPEEIEFPAMDSIKYGTLFGSFYPNFSMADLRSALGSFSVDEKQPLKKMSQGQRKKANIAFALACHTPLLLMDEPTNGLDIPSKTVFRKMLAGYQNPDTLIIISTHQVLDLERLIDAAIILDESQVVLNSTAGALLDAFHFGQLEEGASEIIYSSDTVRGRVGIRRRGKDQQVQTLDSFDLETLFNAAVTVPEKFESFNGR